MKYTDIIKQLQEATEELRSKGVTLTQLDQAIVELEHHASNIEAVENNIDAIREEVISPVKKELRYNQTAGKFSIAGFWVGLLSIIISTTSAVYNSQLTTEVKEPTPAALTRIESKIDELYIHFIGVSGLNPLEEKEIMIGYYGKETVFKSDQGNLQFDLRSTEETKLENKKWIGVAVLDVYLNERRLNKNKIDELIKVSGVLHTEPTEPINEDEDEDDLMVGEGETLIFSNKYRLQVKRVFRTSSNVLPIADKEEALLLVPVEPIE